MPIGRHDVVVIIVAIIARVGVIILVAVVKVIVLANCSYKQNCQ